MRVGTLDQEVARARPADGKREAGQGAEVQFAEPAPWPDPVDGAALLTALAAELRRYVSAEPAALDAIALWVMHAHCHEAADISPVLAITSPEKRCGKTTVLSIVATLVPRPLNTANVTPAALFRSVEKWRPSLLIDEADTILRSSDDLRGILNSGHARHSASILRTVGDDHEPRAFATWSPKAIALIGEHAAARLESAEIVRALGEMEHRPWPEWKAGKPMTAVPLARVLAPFGVRPSNMRSGTGGGVAKG